jgi:hypothetical protein
MDLGLRVCAAGVDWYLGVLCYGSGHRLPTKERQTTRPLGVVRIAPRQRVVAYVGQVDEEERLTAAGRGRSIWSSCWAGPAMNVTSDSGDFAIGVATHAGRYLARR